MSYKAMYIPTSDQIWVDGCKYIDKNGEVFEYDEKNQPRVTHWKDNHRVAQLMIVDMEFNCLKVIGKTSLSASKWVKNGTSIRPVDMVSSAEVDANTVWVIRCPTCGHY